MRFVCDAHCYDVEIIQHISNRPSKLEHKFEEEEKKNERKKMIMCYLFGLVGVCQNDRNVKFHNCK